MLATTSLPNVPLPLTTTARPELAFAPLVSLGVPLQDLASTSPRAATLTMDAEPVQLSCPEPDGVLPLTHATTFPRSVRPATTVRPVSVFAKLTSLGALFREPAFESPLVALLTITVEFALLSDPTLPGALLPTLATTSLLTALLPLTTTVRPELAFAPLDNHGA